MSKINNQIMIEHLREKWKNPCPMCGINNWNVQDTAYELREFHGGNVVFGSGPIIPVVPVICANCGNVVLVNAIVAGAVEKPEEGN